MSKLKNKKYLITILAIFLVAGFTFAYFQSSGTFVNLFNTGTYRVVTTEVFEGPENWAPGQEIPKTITSTNEGTIPAAIRVSYTEQWLKEIDGVETDITNQITNGTVIINLDNTNDWIQEENHYYYKYILKPTETTTSFIRSVTLNSNINGATCVMSQDGLTQVCEASNPALGAKYKLTITKETVQADKYQEVWNTNVEITEKKPTAIQTLMSKASASSEKEPVVIEHNATAQTPAQTDYRYMGANPNNYVLFNCSTDNIEEQNTSTCEVWRVIGIVDGKVKIIRDTSIGIKSWGGIEKYFPQYHEISAHYYEATEWEDSQLYAYLNTTYYNGLSNSAKDAIDESVWYLGDWTSDNTYYNYPDYEPYDSNNGFSYDGFGGVQESIFTEGAYVGERSTNIDNWLEQGTGVESNNHNIKSNGKVGLMYPSDYGYASSVCNSSCIATTPTCNSLVGTYHLAATAFPNESFGYDQSLDRDYSSTECKNSNWLYKNIDEFTINPCTYDYCIHTISSDGYITSPHSESTYCLNWNGDDSGANVRPAVYLKTTATFEGTGTSTDPYKIGG